MTSLGNSPKSVKTFAIWVGAFAVLTITIGLMSLSKLKTEYSVMQFLPGHHPAMQMDLNVRKRFHLIDAPLFIGILNLKKTDSSDWLTKSRIGRLATLTKSIEKLRSVDKVVSIQNVEGAASVDNDISVGRLLDLVPQKQWKQRVLNDNLLTPNLISKNARTILVYVELKDAEVSNMVRFEGRLKKMLAKSFPEASTSVGGVPAIQTDLGLLLNKELINFLLLTILACALTLMLIFKTYSTIWIPLTLTLYCNLMVFTMMAWTGIPFTVLSSTVPILVFIDVMTISCHILLRHYEESHHPVPAEKRLSAIFRTIKLIWLPNALGSLTTSVGFLTLLTSDVPLIRSYGLAVAMSILLSSALTTLGIIPLLLLFPKPVPREWVHQPARWSLWIMANRKPVMLATLGLCIVFALAGRNLAWTGHLFDDLPKNQEARASTEKIDRSMGGVVPLEVVLNLPKGHDWVDPTRVSKLEKLIARLRLIPGVGTALGVPDFLRATSLQNGKLPTKRTGIAESYFLYGMSPDNPLSQYLTNDNRSTRIELKIHDLPADQVQQLIRTVTSRAQLDFPNSVVQTGGMGAIVHTIHREISKDLIFGFWQALFAIVALLVVVFRSLRWALVAAIPNLVPPVLLLGYLALTHTPIKPGVAIIFSIALGLAFTNTVYVLNRLRELMRSDRSLPIQKTFYLESNPCLVSTLVVMMGFSVFLFSYFELNRTFGACMLVSIVAGILGDLAFLPAMLKTAPWLLQRNLQPIPNKVIPFPGSFKKPKSDDDQIRAA